MGQLEDAITVVYQPASGPPRRIRFGPQGDGWRRQTATWTGCGWRHTGSEPVDVLDVDAPDDDGRPGGGCGWRGP